MTAQTTENTKELAKKFANLIGPSDPKLDREVRELLVTARIGLLLRSSFFGNLATRLKLVNADEWLATAATDGRNFYYNSRFVKMLKPKELEFLFGHEVLHVVYDHFGRRGSRDPQLWNVANDYAVNGDLVKHHVGEKITSVPCLYDHKYDNMSSEEIYDHIYENAEKISIDELIERLLDDHLDGEDGDGEGGDGSEKGQGSGKGRPKQLTEEERQQLRDEIKEAVLSAAQAAGAGNLPAGVKRIIQDMTEPKMNWRELLRMQLESTIKTDFTWMRASRKGWHMDAVMPGMKNDDMIDIAVAIDASGSIGDKMLKDFLSEIQGIMDQFQNYKIHIITFDTGVYNPQTYDSDNLDSICDYEVEGGGGTSFECVFEYLKEEQIEPKRLVMFTDGYPFGSWGDENYADTLWILHGTTTIVPPWGQYAYYEEKADK
jgi:predicted metal-dependent peptidase